MKMPVIGETVHYVLGNREHRPAIVVGGAFSDRRVHLRVIMDLVSDLDSAGALKPNLIAADPTLMRVVGCEVGVLHVLMDETIWRDNPGRWHLPEASSDPTVELRQRINRLEQQAVHIQDLKPSGYWAKGVESSSIVDFARLYRAKEVYELIQERWQTRLEAAE